MQSITTGLYATLHAVMFVWLSLHTVFLRRKLRVSLGDAGHNSLRRAVRVHANFAEYVPMCLLLMLLTEQSGAPAWMLHAMGTTLLLARLVHAYGLSSTRTKTFYRPMGLALTLTVMLAASSFILIDLWR